MLQSLKHRGPDSSGFALYGNPMADNYVMRFKVAEQEDVGKGFDIHREMKERRAEVDKRIESQGGEIVAASAVGCAVQGETAGIGAAMLQRLEHRRQFRADIGGLAPVYQSGYSAHGFLPPAKVTASSRYRC